MKGKWFLCKIQWSPCASWRPASACSSFSRHGELWRLGTAGDSFNTALYLQRLGAQVRYFTALGQDPFSEEMLQSWVQEGLDTSLVLRDPARLPGLYAIRTDDRGERSFYYWRQHAAARQLFRLPGNRRCRCRQPRNVTCCISPA